jgi:Transposase DDE domain
MIATSEPLDQSMIDRLRDHDPLVQQYRAFFTCLDWQIVERQDELRPRSGPHPHPETAYLKTFLIKILQEKRYMTQLRTFLLQHPLLVLELGFRPVADATAFYGFDVERTVPTDRWLREKLRCLDPFVLCDLLQQTVHALQEEIAGLGEVIAIDVKHIYAWVRNNNPRESIGDRFIKENQPSGDRDCRVGGKTSSNQVQADGTQKERTEYLWGYGTGIAAATTPEYGDVVIAEYTQTFNQTDVTYFEEVYRRAALALGHFPVHLAADAAFDAWYVYQHPALHGGIAAVPLKSQSQTVFDPDGVPRCPIGLRMHPGTSFAHSYGYRAQRYRCPLLFPQPTGQRCDHAQFAKEKGCVKNINQEKGGQMRLLLDRSTPLYRAVYNQRTSAERINSQAKELGIERPKVRNHRSVERLNTLTYIIVNVRALQKARSINRGLLTPKPSLPPASGSWSLQAA